MELKECVQTRRSIRKFKQEPVPQETIDQMVEMAIYAPSWKNSQAPRYYAVTDPDVIQKVLEQVPDFNQKIIRSAPVLMASTVLRKRSGYNREGEFDTPKGKGWQMYDCGLSNMIFCLAATERGLGTVIMGVYDEEGITKALDLPDEEEIVALIALGYPDEQPVMPRRKELGVILKTL